MVEDMLDFRRDKEKNRHYEFWNSRKLVESVRLLIVKYTDGKNLDACIEQMCSVVLSYLHRIIICLL